MANVKSRLKAPKSASTKKKKTGDKTKTSSTGPKKAPLKKNNTDTNIVRKPPCRLPVMIPDQTGPKKAPLKKNDTYTNMVRKRPCPRPVMTPDQKVKFLLKNGHKLRERFISKQPPSFKNVPEQQATLLSPSQHMPEQNDEQNSNLPNISKNGRLKKKRQSSIKLVASILKNELKMGGRKNTTNTDNEPPKETPSENGNKVPHLRVGVDNNNDIQITDQNNTSQGADDDVVNLSDDTSTNSENESYLDEKSGKKKKKKKSRHIILKNGVVLKLTNYECDQCKKTFNKKSTLRKHMYIHNGTKPFQCQSCPERFRSFYNLKIHVDHKHKLSSLDDTELYICNHCEKPFLVKENLIKHLNMHTECQSSFKCIYCPKAFPYHILLMDHEKKHLVKGRHQCSLCSMSYNCRNLLYLHVKSHLKIKDFICQYCGKEFLRPNSLKRHVEVSHGEHRIVCPICKKILKGHLTEHMRTHEKKRPHVCPECGQRFTQSTQLNVHRRSHSGARPYPCRICKRLFSHSNALMLHIRRHTGEKPFTCAVCPMSFSQSPHMKTHMSKIHGRENPYKCSHCKTFFKRKAERDGHEGTCADGPGGKGKKKKFKKGDEEIEVEAVMSLPRMRFLLALLLSMIATKEKLKYLGFNKRPIDEILIESLEAMDKVPCKDDTLTAAKRLRTNIEMFILGTVPKKQMDEFKKENKSTEDILELLTTEKDE